MRSIVAGAGLCLICGLTMSGEVSYQETTKITGGSITGMMKFAGAFSKDARKLGQPMVTTVAVKGNSMVRDTNDSTEITDLDAQTVTHIDKAKRQYTVTTFAQMKEAMQRAVEKAKAEQAKAPAQNTSASTSQQGADSNVQMNFQTNVRKTGASRQISGLDTNEIILWVGMNGTDKTTGQQSGALGITNDMWMAPDVPAYGEIRDFEGRFAKEMGSAFRTAIPELTGLVRQAQSDDALKAMAKEMSQVKGVPVLQVMRMGMTANGQPLAAASEAPLPSSSGDSSQSGDSMGTQVAKASESAAQQTAAQEASQKLKGALGSGLGSAIGGFGGFGRKKKAATPSAADSATPSSSAPGSGTSNSQQAQSAVLMESTTEIGNFRQQVDPVLFQVPAGFRLVEPRE